MSPSERRQRLVEILCFRRHETCENLALELNVSKRTIYSDFEVLMCSYPIEAVRGRHGGGFKIADGYYLYCKTHCSAANRTLNEEQLELLLEIGTQLKGHKFDVIESIIHQFSSR